MNRFYSNYHISFNVHGNPRKFIFVSRRFAELIKKKKSTWFYSYFEIKPIISFNYEYVSILMSSKGTMLFMRYKDIDKHVQLDCCSELMSLVINKKDKLSFNDLIKFSEKHELEVNTDFTKI